MIFVKGKYFDVFIGPIVQNGYYTELKQTTYGYQLYQKQNIKAFIRSKILELR